MYIQLHFPVHQVGNLVLCLSYDTRLLPLLYVARLLTGCGECTSLQTSETNRPYPAVPCCHSVAQLDTSCYL